MFTGDATGQVDFNGDGIPDTYDSNPTDPDNPLISNYTFGIRAIMDQALAEANAPAGSVSNCPILTPPGSSTFEPIAPIPANCLLANSLYPGGYTPAFSGDVEDISGLIGLRGTLDNGLTYDFSVGLGRNEVSFRIANTWNPSLGPIESPTEFSLGKYIQTEQNYNADFSYPVEVDAFYSDMNVAFGLEYRVETFEIRLGEHASWIDGPYAGQGDWQFASDYTATDAIRDVNADGEIDAADTETFDVLDPSMAALSIGAHGFPGFGPNQAGEFDRANYAAYLEADVTERLLVGAAIRFEDFDDFGTTTNGKIAARFQATDRIGIRGSYSTGFRAPTPGQSNVTKVSTLTVDGVLRQSGQIPPTNPIAQFLGGEALDAEDAENMTFGITWDVTDDLLVTIDWYRIELQDRIARTGQIDIADQAPIADGADTFGLPDGDPSRNLSVCLEELGIPGASDLTSISFFTNDFDTTTTGIDLVATYSMDWGDAGLTDFTAAWTYNETEVDSVGEEVSRNRLLDLERLNPENRGVFTISHLIGDLRLMARASYYDEWTEGSNSDDSTFTPGETDYQVDCTLGLDNCYGDEWVVDLEAAYTYNDRYTFVLGAQNAFDNKGPRDKDNLDGTIGSGNAYETSSPIGFDGGFFYLGFVADLNY